MASGDHAKTFERLHASKGLVETGYGKVRGRYSEGVWEFLGIPYAAPPLAELRWSPPVPPKPWEGIFEAIEPGPIAPQPPPDPRTSIPGDPSSWDEDCLTLNIWVPERQIPSLNAELAQGAARSVKDAGVGGPSSVLGLAPVMVWIHGGGFEGGSGSSALYCGTALARRGQVVVVTLNYRLGVLGFLAHPGLRDPASGVSGNWGLLDQVAALRWVRENIEGFGGDPGNITVFGESAGGMSIAALMASPLARGLFHKAIIESGPPVGLTLESAAVTAEELIGLLGRKGSTFSRDLLEQVPPQELLGAQRELATRSREMLGLPFLPVVDGAFLKSAPMSELLAEGGCNVPLMVGTNRDETTFFSMGDPSLVGLDDDKLVPLVARALAQMMKAQRSHLGLEPENLVGPAAQVVQSYRQARLERGERVDAMSLWVAMSTDWVFRLPAIELAAGRSAFQPATYAYLFDWVSPLLGGVLGSCHALEIPFVFGTLTNPAVALFSGNDEAAMQLSAGMQDAWARFAHSGDPSCSELGEWPAYDSLYRRTMVLGPKSEVRLAPYEEERRSWEVVKAGL